MYNIVDTNIDTFIIRLVTESKDNVKILDIFLENLTLTEGSKHKLIDYVYDNERKDLIPVLIKNIIQPDLSDFYKILNPYEEINFDKFKFLLKLAGTGLKLKLLKIVSCDYESIELIKIIATSIEDNYIDLSESSKLENTIDKIIKSFTIKQKRSKNIISLLEEIKDKNA